MEESREKEKEREKKKEREARETLGQNAANN